MSVELRWRCVVCNVEHPVDHEGMWCGVCAEMVCCIGCERAFKAQCHELLQVSKLRVTCVQCRDVRQIDIEAKNEIELQRAVASVPVCKCGHDRACVEFGFELVSRKRGTQS